MFKYENEYGEYLKIKIRKEMLNNYWIFISLYSNSIDMISHYGLNLDYYAFIKNDTIYNSQLMVKEGMNAIYAYLHRGNTDSIYDDQSFVELGVQSYFYKDNNHGTKKLDYCFLTKDKILEEFDSLSAKLKIDTDTSTLIELLFPSIPNVLELLTNSSDEIKEKTFFEYQKKVNNIMLPLRKKVYKKKYKNNNYKE